MDDDFDRLFGERPPPPLDIGNVNGYGSWLPSDALPLPPSRTPVAAADPKTNRTRTGTPGALMNVGRSIGAGIEANVATMGAGR